MLQDGLEGGCGLGPVGVAEKGRLGGLARAPDNQGIEETTWELGMDTPGELAQALGVLGWEGFAHWFWVTSEGMARSLVLDFSQVLARSSAHGLLLSCGSLFSNGFLPQLGSLILYGFLFTPGSLCISGFL